MLTNVNDAEVQMRVTGTVVELFAESLGWQLEVEPTSTQDRLALQAWTDGHTVLEVSAQFSISVLATRSRLRRSMWSLLAATVESASWHGVLVNLLFPISPGPAPFEPSAADRRLLALLARGQTLRRGLSIPTVGRVPPGTLRWRVVQLRERCGAVHNGHLLALAQGWRWLDGVEPVWCLPPDYATWGPERPTGASKRRRRKDPRSKPSDDWLDDDWLDWLDDDDGY